MRKRSVLVVAACLLVGLGIAFWRGYFDDRFLSFTILELENYPAVVKYMEEEGGYEEILYTYRQMSDPQGAMVERLNQNLAEGEEPITKEDLLRMQEKYGLEFPKESLEKSFYSQIFFQVQLRWDGAIKDVQVMQ